MIGLAEFLAERLDMGNETTAICQYGQPFSAIQDMCNAYGTAVKFAIDAAMEWGLGNEQCTSPPGRCIHVK